MHGLQMQGKSKCFTTIQQDNPKFERTVTVKEKKAGWLKNNFFLKLNQVQTIIAI